MPAYDASRYDPPAPVVSVTLRNQVSGETQSTCELLLDTGADITLLPRKAADQIGATAINGLSYELIEFDGTRSSAAVADLDMVFLSRRFRGKYALVDSEQGVLGRDILNHLVLVLDGPGQNWREA
jgi:predicted aspartyl protease